MWYLVTVPPTLSSAESILFMEMAETQSMFRFLWHVSSSCFYYLLLRGKRPDSSSSEGGELIRQLRQDLLDLCQEEEELDSLLEIAKQSVRNVTADFVTHKLVRNRMCSGIFGSITYDTCKI